MIGALALVAQLDRVPGYGPGGLRFKPSPARFILTMKIDVFPLGPFSTNCYLISDHHDTVLIDPGQNALSTLKKKYHLSPNQVSAIWLTHSHWDHIAGLKECQDFFECPIYVHPLDVENIKSPGSDGLPLYITIPPVLEDIHLISEGDTLKIGKVSFSVIHTPGHCPGSVCFYAKEEGVLISGDTLFKGTMGTLSLPTSEPSKMWVSLKKLGQLPPDTIVYPGHGATTLIKNEDWIHNAEQIYGE